ncbi:phage major capsid protein [Cytobacillus oceanisediminis]|uniref:phage major capsid protein n=1 Tax=Cytobacillus oceanisediminis TaxID=665099 RepID=UPI001C24C844|nr:phage major capsid protein [Cytobacillus oceanisediminis]MBU8733441.1 phage major capsid protein [Cytobacillus oceanisediminis]
MSKELREMLARLDSMKGEVRSLLSEDKADEAEKRMNDVRALQKKIEVQKSLENEDRGGLGLGGEQQLGGGNGIESREDAELENEYRQVFLKGLRRKNISSEERSIITEYEKRAVMHEGGATGQADGDSSLIVPQDIQTRIQEVTRQFVDLSQYVTVENVTALSGSRVIEADAEFTPFPVVEEYAEIQLIDNPKFRPLSYKVVKRGGILPLTNELLADSDQNVIRYVSQWIGKKSVATRNSLVLNQLNTLTKTAMADFDAVRTAINVTLDPAIALSSLILTNQDGFNYLDGLKDANGRYLLQDDITRPGGKMIKGKQVVVVNNRLLASDTVGGTAPIVVGNLKELIVLFSRKFYELASTKEGGDAFKRDTTDLRALMRDDIKTWDSKAAVFGNLDITPTV